MTQPDAPTPVSLRPADRLPLRGFVLLALLSVFWGINWPIMKLGMPAIPVLTFRGATLLVGGLAVLVVARILGHSLGLPRRHWPMLLLSAFFNISVWFSLAGFGVTLTESGRAAIIAYTMPAWSVLFARLLLGEPFTWRRALSLGLGMAAVVILLAGDLAALGRSPLGPALIAIAAASWALGTVIHKKVAWGVPTYVVLGWQVLIGGLPIYVAAPLVDAAAWQPVGLVPILALVYNIIVPFLFCYYAYLEVVRLFPVGIATIGTLFIPILGVFSGALVLGEAPGAAEFAALALVVGALAVPVLTGARAARPPVGPT
ncbi:MAG TPA: DMT family transporter [Alphaproteobacteria bacterium]|nr:DMT family transporter [Alphaproteobacteria bacterium]